jgi:glycyl-tRNA synthetase alpha subunit
MVAPEEFTIQLCQINPQELVEFWSVEFWNANHALLEVDHGAWPNKATELEELAADQVMELIPACRGLLRAAHRFNVPQARVAVFAKARGSAQGPVERLEHHAFLLGDVDA